MFGSGCVMSVRCVLMFIFGRFQDCRAALGTDVASAMVVCVECMRSVISEEREGKAGRMAVKK